MTRPERIIDAHAILGQESYLTLTVDELLRRMDAAAIATAVARPQGSGLIVDNRAGNDLVLSGGPRIRALVSVNPWWGPKSLEELDRCRDAGAVGLFLDPLRQGFFPTEPIATTLYEYAAHVGWPVMIRTGTFVFADVQAVVEVALRYPETNFVAGFGGYADMWFEMPEAIAAAPNLYLDASLLWSDGIAEIADRFGPERVLFGSAEPRNRYKVVIGSLDRLELSQEASDLIYWQNARRIFALEESA